MQFWFAVTTLIENLIFGPGSLRAPPKVAFTMHSWPLTHFRETPEAEILFPPKFGITRRYIRGRGDWLIFIFYKQKHIFRPAFDHGCLGQP